MQVEQSLSAPPTLMTVKQFSQRHPAFTEGALRMLIFNSQPRASSKGTIPGNGMADALIYVGRRILINEQRFFEWLEEQN